MSTRKTVLVTLIGILAAIYAGQLVLSGRNQVRELTLGVEPDTVVIENAHGTVTLALKDGTWAVSGASAKSSAAAGSETSGSETSPDSFRAADAAAVDTVLRTAGTLKVLGTVAPDGDGSRYGFSDGKGIEVTLLKNGQAVRTLTVGKTSVTTQQTYVQLDGKKDVLLVSGNVPALLNKSADDFRSRKVYALSAADIGGVTVTLGAASGAGAQSYALEKSGEPPRWQLVPDSDGSDLQSAVDAEKAASWIDSLSALNVVSWAPDNVVLPDSEEAAGTVTLSAVSSGEVRTVRVTVFGKDDDGNYLCTSDAVPYAFYLSSYAAEKYLKPLSALAAD